MIYVGYGVSYVDEGVANDVLVANDHSGVLGHGCAKRVGAVKKLSLGYIHPSIDTENAQFPCGVPNAQRSGLRVHSHVQNHPAVSQSAIIPGLEWRCGWKPTVFGS